MCFFQVVKCEMFTSEPRLKGDYYQPGETDEQYRKRQFARRRQARDRTIAATAASRTAGRIIALRRASKVAE